MLDEVEKIIFQLDEVATPEELDDYSLEELAKLVLQGRELVRVLRDVVGRVEQALVRSMPHKKMTIEGVGVLEKSTETSRKEWDHPLLAGSVLRAALERWKQETGEVIDEDIAHVVLQAFMTAARPEWRVTALRDMGIEADNYCQVSYGAQKVRITT